MCMWDSLSEKVYRNLTKEELKQRITECWELRKSIGSWKKRLRAVCGEDGGPIDHLFALTKLHVVRTTKYVIEALRPWGHPYLRSNFAAT
jgi:hypothetical protein